MNKKLKSSTDNQWISVSQESSKCKNLSNKKEKTATDNQWTSTAKNTFEDKK
ncbi:hypothetical protein [Alkalithermobacter paradoxus]|uniref:Uncharacterized protein n=1 Tax=Alkalithermobacter paradoxus TaxID=29349 RepID=A0A1V4IC90_9FIRM|nr:hypothetical protein CLOTH_05180 [[Clostridium] thermoalcaliphilum]